MIAGSCAAQVPTNFGSNIEDGIVYQTYSLIDHGMVSSVRIQAQNAIAAGDGTWEFYTDNYNQTWRPYLPDDTLSGYDAVIDPSVETASARYNSFLGGGATGKLPAVQAGYYYTFVIGNNEAADNFMSVLETDFDPVAIDTVFNTPTDPTEQDPITVTVQLNGALSLSPGEHVFIRASADGYATSTFLEVTNFSNGVGTVTLPAGTIPAGTTVNYYALVTEQTNPVAETIDFFTLFFGNNSGQNYSFTVSPVTGIRTAKPGYELLQDGSSLLVRHASDWQQIQLLSLDGRTVASSTVNDGQARIATGHLPSAIYVLELKADRSAQYRKVHIE